MPPCYLLYIKLELPKIELWKKVLALLLYLSCCFLPQLFSFSPSSFFLSPLFWQSHLPVMLSNLAVYCHECKRTLIFTSWGEFPPPPKRGWKRGQSNTDPTNTKRAKATKATTKSDVEGSGEEEPEAEKGTTKGKGGGKKGKKQGEWLVLYQCLHTNYSIQNDRCPASSQRQGWEW